MRQRFAASLAASSAASYLLGIGDRHLDNFLLCTQTLEVVPIDFGYSFGIGALLPVPEIAPFRLTGFFSSVLRPLSGDQARGTFHAGLAEVLRRIREDRDLILDLCEIFLQEPLMDWAAEARRRGEALDFMPRRRLRFVRDRLLGAHPAKVLFEELTDNQIPWVRDFLRRPGAFDDLVVGSPDASQTFARGGRLSHSEQADVLIRQATDPNVLGRAWEGWAPEV